MRKIKFKVWDKIGKYWFDEGIILDFVNRKVIHCYDNQQESMDGDRIELVEYTGLKDKNGKEIYEGDVIKDSYDGSTHNVKYNEAQFDPFGFPSGWNKGEWENVDYRECEIIGNIYENPELLND